MIHIQHIGSSHIPDRLISQNSNNLGTLSFMLTQSLALSNTITGLEYDLSGQLENDIVNTLATIQGLPTTVVAWRVGDTIYVESTITLGNQLGITPIQRSVYTRK